MTRAPDALRTVALVELAKGVLVLVAAGTIAGLLPVEAQNAAEALVRHFHMNPARRDPQVFLDTLRHFADAHKLALSIGALCYAGIRFVEAYGLWHRRSWAWGFGVLSGGIYIPLELVELSRQLTWAGLTVLLVNVAVVVLLWRSRRSAA